MKKEQRINNLHELRLEMKQLKAQAREQEEYLTEQYGLLKQKVSAPVRFVNNLISWVPGVGIAKDLLNTRAGKSEGDWVSRLFSAGSAALMNRLFLRKTGFLKRILLTAFTQQTAGLMNQDRAVSLIKQVADWIRGTDGSEDAPDKTTKKRLSRKGRVAAEKIVGDKPPNVEKSAVPPTVAAPDFGIPPHSETS